MKKEKNESKEIKFKDLLKYVKSREESRFEMPKEFHKFITSQRSLHYRGFHFSVKYTDGRLLIECIKKSRKN